MKAIPLFLFFSLSGFVYGSCGEKESAMPPTPPAAAGEVFRTPALPAKPRRRRHDGHVDHQRPLPQLGRGRNRTRPVAAREVLRRGHDGRQPDDQQDQAGRPPPRHEILLPGLLAADTPLRQLQKGVRRHGPDAVGVLHDVGRARPGLHGSGLQRRTQENRTVRTSDKPRRKRAVRPRDFQRRLLRRSGKGVGDRRGPHGILQIVRQRLHPVGVHARQPRDPGRLLRRAVGLPLQGGRTLLYGIHDGRARASSCWTAARTNPTAPKCITA